MRINRPEISRRLYNSLRTHGYKITNAHASIVLDEVLEFIMDSVGEGDEVNIAGFGVFKREYRNPTVKSNPQRPGEKLQIEGYHYVKFKPYGKFKDTAKNGSTTSECATGECPVN